MHGDLSLSSSHRLQFFEHFDFTALFPSTWSQPQSDWWRERQQWSHRLFFMILRPLEGQNNFHWTIWINNIIFKQENVMIEVKWNQCLLNCALSFPILALLVFSRYWYFMRQFVVLRVRLCGEHYKDELKCRQTDRQVEKLHLGKCCCFRACLFGLIMG